MSLTQEQRREVKAVFTNVVSNAFERLHGLTLAQHAVNPFLAPLVAKTPASLAQFIVAQRLERSIVTSMGNAAQKIARITGTFMKSSGVAGADLEGFEVNLKRHLLMQVKIGPDTVNKDIGDSIESKLAEAERRVKSGGMPPGWVVVRMLGMCYGQPRHRNNWVMRLETKGFDVSKIGRQFWTFTTGDPAAYKEVFEIALDVGTTYKNGSKKTLAQATSDAIVSLTAEIERDYGDSQGGIVWDKLLEDNM